MTIDSILRVVLSFVAAIPAIVLHEVAHGFVAYRLGDPTARTMGRLTLNPLAHIDPIGTVLVPLILVVLGGPVFGWAKPVPINPRYFRNPFQGMLYVAVAGPTTNVVLGMATILIGRLLLLFIPLGGAGSTGFLGSIVRTLFALLGIFVLINLFLAVLNMIPVPPLDGSRVLTYFLPPEGKRFMLSLERYGLLIFAALIFLGGLDWLFNLILRVVVALLGMEWFAVVWNFFASPA